MATYKYKYGENIIEIQSWDLGGCELRVNGQIIDKHKGMHFGARTLTGKLDSGEEIQAKPGGAFKDPTLFVNNKWITTRIS
ncbi:MAG: hypothetical protein FWG14_09385 [Peptococcaceae bacterium]|nr:hypothetical protein [Peptococcaceae bacterium]